ncbi:copper radical oxidase [Mycena alexandri]|uniref:Copper radical oxidase n=1 Tax=Mycena alexandri TaxID=1745969 RepID=A0AAD6RYJ6_9AGAR|nr:copper radical oxidase [Mycena alexandri]
MARPRVFVGVLALSAIRLTSASTNHIFSAHNRRQSIPTDLPKPWTYVGCFVDNAHGRIVTNQQPDNAQLTIESCVQTCSTQNFTVAAAEFGVICGVELIAGAATAPASDCNMGCGGNTTYCGAGNRMSVYSTSKNVTILPVPVPQNSSIPGSWTYQGCLMEAVGSRAIPWQNIYPTNNSATTCLGQCMEYGEYSPEYCGDVSDVKAAGVGFAPASDCNLPCPGDPIHLCGAGNRIQYYTWTGTPPYVWHTPTNIGHYDVCRVVVPLIATVGNQREVRVPPQTQFPLSHDTRRFDNSTGAYELDLSLVNQFNKAWRTMHVKSDVFCSGSVVLPDKGGRILNVGGWSLDSTQGVRLYTPDGSAGVNGTNDWQENFKELALQRQRWYPAAAVLANGSTGSNAAPPPAHLISKFFLNLLGAAPPYNLIPSYLSLPSGRIFVIYYNEARILDPKTFDTVVQLPNLPASAPAVILPQHAPYTAPITILTCGGSAPGAGIALDNCVSITPEGPNPKWTLERMPSQRYGTFMIMNGAHQGLAGFGLASNPNLGALLYDPSQPVTQRISILNTTIVARLYHSERIIPPYLTQGFTQPSFTITTTDWAYGSSHPIVVHLPKGSTSTMKVSLIAAVSSTHGNAMGARTIFPAFSCSGTTCTITAPPNAFVSPPGWHQLFILDGPTPSHSTWVRMVATLAKSATGQTSPTLWCQGFNRMT